MGLLKRFFQPSLSRRVMLALSLAFLLVFVVLIARDYLSFRSTVAKRQALQTAATALEASLTSEAVNDVRVIMQSVEVQYRMLRRDAYERAAMACPGDILFHIARTDGTPVYASAALVDGLPDAQALQANETEYRGQNYWGVSHHTDRWHITVLEPVLTDAVLLPALGRQMLTPMLIAFPLILLPLWLAVRRGLAPLRALTDSVTHRNPKDFSPLTRDLPYAELKPLVKTFNELFARSRLSIARERAVVQDAAHELRTPLAVVAAEAHHLINASNDDERQQAKHALEQAIRRSSHMAHQLLTLASFEGREGRTTQRADLVELARQAVISMNPRVQEKRAEITLESPDALVTDVDTQAYLSVLENLITNAIHYGRPQGRIAVSLALNDARVTLEVADDGPGIAPTDAAHLFDRFYRGKDVVAPGAGLGLAIVKQAVARMNGHITLGQGLNSTGVRFSVKFPAGASGGDNPVTPS